MYKIAYPVFLLFFTSTLSAQCISGNCINGTGTYLFKSGAKYQGTFKDGRMQGEGTCYFSDGKVYSGEWVGGQRQGSGILQNKNGDFYKGNFVRNQMQGEGTLHFKNGDKFRANWRNGQTVGLGSYIHANGESKEGTWEKGKFKEVLADGNEGTFEELQDCNRQDCKSGIGQYVYADGSLYEGEFLDNRPQGLGTCNYSNGDKYVGDWKDDKPDGSGTMYYANKSELTGEWAAGRYLATASAGKEKLKSRKEANTDVNIYALIVGVARYTSFESLKYTDDDAYRIYAFLKSPEGGAVPDKNIRILIDESAVASNISKSLDDIVALADENDVIITYFAGHGVNGYFIPFDCNGYQNKVDYNDVKTRLAMSRAKQKLCIVDACHSGSLLAMKAPVMESLNLFYSELSSTDGGTAFLMSSKEEEFSLESMGLRQGIFSHFLIEGLKGYADTNANSIVTIDELYSFIYKKVKDYTGDAQTPVLAGTFDKTMPIAMIR